MNLFVGLFLVGISIPLWMEKVPRNGWYGVRLEKSLESDENWYRINRFGGLTGVLLGGLIALVGVLGFVRPPATPEMEVLALMASTFLLLPWLVVNVWYAGRL